MKQLQFMTTKELLDRRNNLMFMEDVLNERRDDLYEAIYQELKRRLEEAPECDCG